MSLPNVEAIVVDWLLDSEDVTDLVDDQVFSDGAPTGTEGSWVNVTWRGGTPTGSAPRRLEGPSVQVSCYAATKAGAFDLLDAVIDRLSDPTFATAHDLGVVTGVSWGVTAYVPDPAYSPAQPRYVVDLTVHSHG